MKPRRAAGVAPTRKPPKTRAGSNKATHPVGPFALAGHEWFSKQWAGNMFARSRILRESPSGKSILVRVGNYTTQGVEDNPKDNLDVSIDARHGLQTLFHRAGKGDEAAATALAELLRNQVSEFSRLCRKQPRLFHRVARQSWRWPVMMSTHPGLRDDYELICRGVQLGRETPLNLTKGAKWKWDDAAEVAFGLLTFLWLARAENRAKIPTENWGYIGKVVDRLPPFNKKSAGEWWKFARVVFDYSYPEPEKIPELAALVKAESKRKTPGKIREDIFRKLKDRFTNFPAYPT